MGLENHLMFNSCLVNMYCCVCCGKMFKVLSNLVQHNNRYRPCREPTYCNDCNRDFVSRQSLWKMCQPTNSIQEDDLLTPSIYKPTL